MLQNNNSSCFADLTMIWIKYLFLCFMLYDKIALSLKRDLFKSFVTQPFLGLSEKKFYLYHRQHNEVVLLHMYLLIKSSINFAVFCMILLC